MPLDVTGQSGLPPGRPQVPRDRPGRRRLGVALRRLMVTPTFAAGLGVVVAASLAVNMTKTVLHFSSPMTGGQCAVGTCHPQPARGGTLASARPGVHITSPRAPAGGAGQRRMRAGNAPDDRGSGGPQQQNQPGTPVVVGYRLMQQWPGGFADEITIGSPGGRHGSWSLSLAYPSARIAGVQGAAWAWHSADSGVAQGQNGHGSGAQGGGAQPSARAGSAQFIITVEGQSQPPSGCTLNGVPCSFSAADGPG